MDANSSMLGGGTQGNAGIGTGYKNPRGLNTYPSMYFDLSSQEMPRTVKETFKWCLFLYLTHSEIAPTINKKCAYVITDIVYDTDSVKDKKVWKETLEDILEIQEFKYLMMLDYEVFGNAFCSLSFPFERSLKCGKCEGLNSIADKDLTWRYREHKFEGVCLKCGKQTGFEAVDKDVQRIKSLKLIRWFPDYIKVIRNEITGKTRHHYQIPKWIKKGIVNDENDENKYLVEDMPMVFLEAVKSGKDVEFDAGTFYHMKAPTISYHDQSFGIPPILAIFKDAWLYQTYRRAQEAIAMEHVLPMRLLVPRAQGGDHSPHMHNSLSSWSQNMQQITDRWRRDPNAMFTVPFPAEVQTIGGDAQALNVHNDMTQIRSNIATGLDLPLELAQGTTQWSGSSVALRMLENQYIGRIKQLDKFLNGFVIPKVRAWGDLPDIEIKHRDFKMADDAQQKQIAISLRQTNTLSDRTVIQELGFDYSKEQAYKRTEEEDRNAVLVRQMTSQAEAQGAAQVIAAKFEARAQAAQQAELAEAEKSKKLDEYSKLTGPKAQSDMSTVANAVGAPGPADIAGSSYDISASTLDLMAENFMKSTPPDMMDDMMQRISKKTPQLAAAVARRQRKYSDSGRGVKPLPEQKPPRGASAGI